MRSLVFALFLAAGCGSTPEARHYVLLPLEEESAQALLPGVVVSLRVLGVPELIDRPQMVWSAGAHERRLDEFARWAGPVGPEVERVLARNLEILLGTDQVFTSEGLAVSRPTIFVTVSLLRLEASDTEALLEARWMIDAGVPRVERQLLRAPLEGAGAEAVAAAQSRSLATLSRAIAEAIRHSAQ